MNENTLGYIIVGISDDKKLKFFARDANSGGYPYWSTFITAAEIFSDSEKAESIVQGRDFTSEDRTIGGKVYPPVMVHSGAGLCNTKTKGELVVYIRPLIVGPSISGIKFNPELP